MVLAVDMGSEPCFALLLFALLSCYFPFIHHGWIREREFSEGLNPSLIYITPSLIMSSISEEVREMGYRQSHRVRSRTM